MALNRLIFSLFLLLIFPLIWKSDFACFNTRFRPDFVFEQYPGEDLPGYFSGNLGILRPRFHRPFSFVAFRHLSEAGLEPEAARKMAPHLFPDTTVNEKRPKEPRKLWASASAPFRTLSEATVKRTFSNPEGLLPGTVYRRIREDNWQRYLNCPDSAFTTAAATLKDRMALFGRYSKEVPIWVKGQDMVFANCSEGATIPPTLPESTHPLIRADREYQIAAAHFYSGSFDEAARRFEAIADKDSSDSPWQKWGLYMKARCFIRKGTLLPVHRQIDRASLETAAEYLRTVLADPELSHAHNSAHGLLNFIRARLEPEERFSELALKLEQIGSPPGSAGEAAEV